MNVQPVTKTVNSKNNRNEKSLVKLDKPESPEITEACPHMDEFRSFFTHEDGGFQIVPWSTYGSNTMYIVIHLNGRDLQKVCQLFTSHRNKQMIANYLKNYDGETDIMQYQTGIGPNIDGNSNATYSWDIFEGCLRLTVLGTIPGSKCYRIMWAKKSVLEISVYVDKCIADEKVHGCHKSISGIIPAERFSREVL